MAEEIKLSKIENRLEQLSYPVGRNEAAGELAEVTLLLADGEANLGNVVSETPSEEFDSVEDLMADIHNALPREAVGEPYQSEGEG